VIQPLTTFFQKDTEISAIHPGVLFRSVQDTFNRYGKYMLHKSDFQVKINSNIFQHNGVLNRFNPWIIT